MAGLAGIFSSLMLDSSGYPRVGYYDAVRYYLKYAAWNGLSWDIQIVDERDTGAR
jgi:hypothetical protein